MEKSIKKLNVNELGRVKQLNELHPSSWSIKDFDLMDRYNYKRIIISGIFKKGKIIIK